MNPINHFKLHWKARTIKLEDIDVPPENILVGVKLNGRKWMRDHDFLSLEAYSLPFNYTSGEIEATGFYATTKESFG